MIVIIYNHNHIFHKMSFILSTYLRISWRGIPWDLNYGVHFCILTVISALYSGHDLSELLAACGSI